MRWTKPSMIIAAAGAVAALATFIFASTSDSRAVAQERAEHEAAAIFAGGCFWCVESDFDKVDGVLETVSGYTGGWLENPSYEQVSYEETGHYEAVKVVYDPSKVSYGELVDYFWRHVDPTDDGGQFCDRGPSYRTAIFAGNKDELALAKASKADIEQSGVLPGAIVTPVLEAGAFWPAEDYHQNYQRKNPLRYSLYRNACGRDARVKEVWKNAREAS